MKRSGFVYHLRAWCVHVRSTRMECCRLIHTTMPASGGFFEQEVLPCTPTVASSFTVGGITLTGGISTKNEGHAIFGCPSPAFFSPHFSFFFISSLCLLHLLNFFFYNSYFFVDFSLAHTFVLVALGASILSPTPACSGISKSTITNQSIYQSTKYHIQHCPPAPDKGGVLEH